MEAGFIVDHAYAGVAPPEWAEGKVEKSEWTGVKILGKDRRAVQTYRCTKCGFLEAYAP